MRHLVASILIVLSSGSAASDEVPYGCSLGPWRSILSRIPAVQELLHSEDGVNLTEPPQPTCNKALLGDSRILYNSVHVLVAFFSHVPGLEDKCTITDSVGESAALLNRDYEDMSALLLSLLRVPPVFIVYKPRGTGFPLEFRTRGSLYTLRGTIQGDGNKTWAHVNTGDLKFGSTFTKVYPGRTEKDAKPNAPINKETQILIYSADIGDIDRDMAPVVDLKHRLSLQLERSLLPQVIARFEHLTGPEAEAAKQMIRLYKLCKRDYLDSKSAFHPDWQMDRLNDLRKNMESTFLALEHWLEPAQYRSTNPDAPTVYINHDENCFIITALAMIVNGLPRDLLDSSLASSQDERLRQSLGFLVERSREGSAVEEIHDFRVSLGERFMWAGNGAASTVIEHLRATLPILKSHSVVLNWDLREQTAQQALSGRDEVYLIIDIDKYGDKAREFTDADLRPQPVKVVFVKVNAVNAGLKPNLTFTSNLAHEVTYDLTASIDLKNSHFTVDLRQNPDKWFRIDNHRAWQILPKTPNPWRHSKNDAPICNQNTRLLMYVLRGQGTNAKKASAD